MDKNTIKILKLEDERYTFSDEWLKEETIGKTTYHVIHGNWEGRVEKYPHYHDEKLIKYGTYLRKIKLLAIYERPTLFYLQIRRYQCLKCRKTASCEPYVVKNIVILQKMF